MFLNRVLPAATLLLLQAFGNAYGNGTECKLGELVPIGDGKTGVQIDRSWSGSTVVFDAISRHGKKYFGYYDADRWLTVAQLDPVSGIVCRARLNSRYTGWDSHNSIVLAFDKSGRLQVAGNMHATPLVYGEASSPDTVSNVALSSMVGRDEEKVTYPSFITGQDGSLYFAYRSGVSGDGEWFVNARDGMRWKRTLDVPIFSAKWDGLPTNGYPSPFRVFEDGYIHMAVVWRRSPDVASNYAITYARTRDFSHWEDHIGRPITLPIDPGNSDVVDMPGEGKGLLNLARVGITQSGKPVIAYTKFGPTGKNSIVVASPSSGGWNSAIIATAESQTDYKGNGTIPNFPALGQLEVNKGSTGGLNVAFPGEKNKFFSFEIDTLKPTTTLGRVAQPRSSQVIDISPPSGLVDTRKTLIGVRIDGQIGGKDGTLVYFSQGKNRDRPRNCSLEQPIACNPPPSPLVFVP